MQPIAFLPAVPSELLTLLQTGQSVTLTSATNSGGNGDSGVLATFACHAAKCVWDVALHPTPGPLEVGLTIEGKGFQTAAVACTSLETPSSFSRRAIVDPSSQPPSDGFAKLCQDVVQIVALEARDLSQLLRLPHFSAHNQEDVKRAVSAMCVSVSARGNYVDLNLEGCRLLKLELFQSEAERRKAATRIALRLRRQLLPSQPPLGEGERVSWEKFTPFVDKETFLELHSDGGVMSGFRDSNECDDPTDEAVDDEARVKRAREEDITAAAANVAPRNIRHITSMKQLQEVHWEEGDLASSPYFLPETIAKKLKAVQLLRQDQLQRCPSFPLTSDEEFAASKKLYSLLLSEYNAVQDKLTAFANVCLVAEPFSRSESSAARGGEVAKVKVDISAQREIRDWMAQQMREKEHLLRWRGEIGGELDLRERELREYVALQELRNIYSRRGN